MKLSNKIILAFGAAACVGLVYSTAGLAGTEKAADVKSDDTTGSYGTTLTKIISTDGSMFSHQAHVVDIDLDCDSCHPDTFQKKRGAAEAAGDYNMKSLEEGKYCGVCHDGDTAFGVTDGDSCVTCHGDMKEMILKETGDFMFSHRVHVEDMGLDCDSCHPDLFKQKRGAAEAAGDYTMKSLEEGKYCGACHDGDTAFGVKDPETCITCHGSDMKQPGTIVFEKPVKAVVFDHKKHTEDIGLACSDCHNDLFKMKMGNAEEQPEKFVMEALYAGKYCGGCHDGESAFASDTKCATCHIGVIGFDRLFGDKTAKGEGHEGH
jgi:c(7)-type cytochrome triheme protein